MNPQRHRQVRELFLRTLDLAENERDAFLDRECVDDEALRVEVDSLLEYHRTGTILAPPRAPPPSPGRYERSMLGPWLRFWRTLISPGRRRYLTAIAILALLTLVGLQAEHHTRTALEHSVRAQLVAIRDGAARSLSVWMTRERDRATHWASTPMVVDLVDELIQQRAEDGWVEAPSALLALRELLYPLWTEKGGFGVLDREGRVLGSSVLEEGDTIDLSAVRVAPDAGSDFIATLGGETILRMPHEPGSLVTGYDPDRDEPTMTVIAPVRRGGLPATAVLVLGIDPGPTFTRILASARLGDTGETYAIDSHGVMLSESRYDDWLVEHGLLAAGQPSMLNLRVLEPGPDGERRRLTEAARDLVDGEGPIVGDDVDGYLDYRGVEVVGAWRWLPDEGFGVITEIDGAQAYEPMMPLKIFVWLLFGGLVLCVGLLLAVTWSKSRVEQLLRELGEYQIDELIGRGGMGEVYRAHHKLLARPTAVKLLHPERMSHDMRQRFQREGRLTSELTHPNTIAIYDYGETPVGLYYYAMEYLPFPTLREVVDRGGPMEVRRVVHVLIQICGSLREAHLKGLVHRDIKPSNIILCERGGVHDVVKVLDFGLVKPLDVEGFDKTITETGTLSGTPLYMAPERIRRPHDVDGRADLYAVGAVAYRLLTGRDVFVGEVALEILSAVLEEDAPRLSLRAPRPPPKALDDLVAALLAKDPDDRPKDADAVLVVLRELQAELSPWTEEEAQAAAEAWDALPAS